MALDDATATLVALLADDIANRVTDSVPGTVSYRDAVAAAAADALARAVAGAGPVAVALDTR